MNWQSGSPAPSILKEPKSSHQGTGINFVQDKVRAWSVYLNKLNIKYDGHTGIYPGKIAILHEITENLPAGSMHCEIGLNAGHSAVAVLEGNPEIFVTSFEYYPISEVVHQLNIQYGGRIKVIPGDSNLTVPAQKSLTCDSILIDGDHSPEAIDADARNMCNLSSTEAKTNTVIVFDDIGSLDPVRHLVDEKVISKGYRCISELAFDSIHTKNMYENNLDWTNSGVAGSMCRSECI